MFVSFLLLQVFYHGLKKIATETEKTVNSITVNKSTGISSVRLYERHNSIAAWSVSEKMMKRILVKTIL